MYKITPFVPTPQPFYKDGREVLPNPSRTYIVRNMDAPESIVTCAERPDQVINWTLYHHNNKVYAKSPEAAMWRVCEIVAAPEEAVPQTAISVASKKSRVTSKVRVYIMNVLQHLKL